MQRLNFIIILLFFLFASCARQKPKGVLSEKDMTGLMTEVALIDAYLNTLPIDSGRKVMPVLYGHAFNKFKLDSTGFVLNLDYYMGNPNLTEKLYNTVNKTLTAKDMEYRQLDSIRNIAVQDSLQHVMQLQRYTAMLKNMIMNVYRDSSSYTYTSYGADFLTKAELNLNAYGIQAPVVNPIVAPRTQEKNESEGEAVSLSRHTAMLSNMIMNVYRDSSSYTYTSYGADFLAKAGLTLNAYGIQTPVVNPMVVPRVQEIKGRDEESAPVDEPVEERLDTVRPMPMLDTSGVKKVLRKSLN